MIISNPQSNPQYMMSCATSAYFGSPRGLLSCCIDTVEVCGSSPHGPTIFFSDLASTTLLDQAPIGSIKEVVGHSQGLHVCGRRLMRRTRLPREQWSVSITGTESVIDSGTVTTTWSLFLAVFDATRDHSVSSNDQYCTAGDRMVA